MSKVYVVGSYNQNSLHKAIFPENCLYYLLKTADCQIAQRSQDESEES